MLTQSPEVRAHYAPIAPIFGGLLAAALA